MADLNLMPKDEKDVSTTSLAYDRMRPRWDLLDAVLGGTETLRAADRDYLPQYEEESDRAYNTRLERATAVNFLEMVLDALVGRPFAEPVVLQDDVPDVIRELCEDVDLQGANVDRFAQEWFRDGLAMGLSHVLVDFPVTSVEEGRVRTLEDDRAEGVRPYWVHVRPQNVIGAFAETVRGRTRLTHVRIRELSVERNGYAEVEVHRIRVHEPGTWQLFRYDPREKRWNLEEEGMTGLDEVPLVTFYANKRDGLMECKPPLLDVAHLNLAHWQSASDQRHVLTVSRFPILAVSGVGEDLEKVRIGPNQWLSTPDPQGKWYYVEHSGAAIEAGRKDLEDIERQIAAYGAEFLKKKPGTQTATERALDSAESSSALQSMVLSFKDALEQVLMLTAKWLKLDDGGSVRIRSDFSDTDGGTAEGELLLKMRVAREISRVAFLSEMQRRGTLSEDFDPEEDQALLDEEGPEVQPPPTPGQTPPRNQPPAPQE